MTALDQAFVKAFMRQGMCPVVVPPRPAVHPLETEERETRNAEPPEEIDSAARNESEAPSIPLAAFRPPVSAPVRVPNPQPLDVSPPSSAVLVHEAALAPPPLDGVWAALERPPRGATNLLKVERISQARRAVAGELASCSVEAPRARVQGSGTAEIIQPPIATLQPVIAEPKPVVPEPQPVIPNPLSLVLDSLPPASPASPTRQEFKPAWQVDSFAWPKVCRRLIARAAEELDRLADALLTANVQGRTVLAIAGCQRGEGATTLLLCAARRLAERGIKPVLVDADLRRPQLAERLGVHPQFGWDEISESEGRSLNQAIVEATANNLALLPAHEPSSDGDRPASDAARLGPCLEVLRNHYDMVLVDLGPLEEIERSGGGFGQFAAAIDAVMLVHNLRITSEEQLMVCEGQLADAGIATAGIIENFVGENG